MQIYWPLSKPSIFQPKTASACSVVSTKQILGSLPFQLPIVEFNGAYITDYHTGKHLIAHEFPTDIKEALLSFLLEHNCPPFISGFDEQKDCLYYDQIVNDAMSYYRGERTRAGDKRLQKISNIEEGLRAQIVCFTVLQKNPIKKDIQSLLHEAFGDNLNDLPMFKTADRAIAVETPIQKLSPQPIKSSAPTKSTASSDL